MATEHDGVELVEEDVVLKVVMTVAVAALMAALSQIAVPLPWAEAPATLQVLGVFIAGIYLGALWGSAAMVLFLLAGAIGIPVFSGFSGGIGVLFAHTGGFLIAFPIGAAIVGLLTHRGLELTNPNETNPLFLVAGMVLATGVIYVLGVVRMAQVLELSIIEATMVGAVPFIPVEIAEIIVVLALVGSARVAELDWPP